MESYSTLMIVGEPLKNENFVTYDQNNFTEDTFTITEFKITKILENSTGTEYNNGDVIRVAEPTYIVDNGIIPGKTRFSINGYELMTLNQRYILFLKADLKYPDIYVISGINEGKLNLDNNSEIENLHHDKEKIKLFKEQTIKKYQLQ